MSRSLPKERLRISEITCAKALRHKRVCCAPGRLRLGARQGAGYQQVKIEIRPGKIFGATLEFGCDQKQV